MSVDPFERAAARERREELRQEARKAAMAQGAERRHGPRFWRRGTEGSGTALRVFLFPWVLWGLLRASNHPWDENPVPQALFDFFFGSWPYAVMTGWVLFLMWVWFIGTSDD